MLRLEGPEMMVSAAVDFLRVRVGRLIKDDEGLTFETVGVFSARCLFFLRHAALRQQALMLPNWLHAVLIPGTLRMLRNTNYLSSAGS